MTSTDSNEVNTGAPQLILPLLMARHTQLKDILHAHHLIGNIDVFLPLQVTQTTIHSQKASNTTVYCSTIGKWAHHCSKNATESLSDCCLAFFSGGYDVVEVDSGRRVCFSLSTAYEDTYLDTYHLELDLTRGVRIHRHDIPPSIPLKKLAQENLENDLPAFLHTLWQHVSGLASRLYQIKLIKVWDRDFLLFGLIKKKWLWLSDYRFIRRILNILTASRSKPWPCLKSCSCTIRTLKQSVQIVQVWQ